MSYITTAQLKSWLHVTDTTDDSLYDMAVAAASDAIDKATNRRFTADTATSLRVYAADSWWRLPVDDIADGSTVSVALDKDRDGTYETPWTVGTNYQLEPVNHTARPVTVIRSLRDPFPVDRHGRALVQVTAKWGWTGAVPNDVVLATTILAARYVKRKDAPSGVLGFGDMGGVVRVTQSDRDVIGLIGPYKRTRATG